ncbi:hypothetical protein EDC04DRAFT_2910537 [Pisolithus marmoratus]|nr:hypothetical protein EDC04DRAFT_2910537 [Pisolithus marmoratus]
MATQDEPVNPMAPDYPEDEQESQILPWVVESILPFAEQSPEVQPLFKHSQPGQPFSFKLPSQASTGSTQSTRLSNSDSSSAKSHTIFAKNTEGRLDSDEDSLVIDEVSPSEDDHCVEAVVCGETGDPGHSGELDEKHSQSGTLQFQGDHGSMNMQQREIEDIVIQHRQCNHAPQLPDNTQLLAVHDQQRSKTPHCISHSKVDALDSLEGPISKTSSSSTEATPTPLLATSVTSGIVPNSNSDPSHLQFYTLPVRDIIEHAKQISHCDIASVNSFPLHAEFNHKAPEYMNEAIAEHCSQGLAIPSRWWPQYLPDITKLLWEDHGNWHSVLKKKACTFVHEHYKWDPQNHCPINAELAKSLLDHCSRGVRGGRRRISQQG